MLRSVVVLALLASTALAFRGAWHEIRDQVRAVADPCAKPNDCGDPLYLTPFIRAGNITGARAASAVNLAGFNFSSFSGYFTTNDTTKNQMFFWYFPPQNKDAKAPLILWLQGGPGATSLFGLFGEMGPITVTKELKPSPKPFTWNSKYGMIFIDQPVGTGYSQQGAGGRIDTVAGVGRELLEALTQFFTVFSELRGNEFYVAGESYGGKYAPAITAAIHDHNRVATNKLPLTGMMLGDPWSDPQSHMPAYAGLVYNFALIDENQAAIVNDLMARAEHDRKTGKLVTAFDYWNAFWGDYDLPYPPLFVNFTGGDYTENMAFSHFPDSTMFANFYLYVAGLAATRKSLHVGSLPFGGVDIYKNFVDSGDFMSSILPLMTRIVENYRVLIYNGNMDGICGAPTTDTFVSALQWDGAKEYARTGRTIWKVRATDGEVAGYSRSFRQFYRVIVRNAGHLLPLDQPERAFDMIDRFVSRRGFH